MKSLDNLDELFGETLGNTKKPIGNSPSDKMGAMMAELDEYQEPEGTMEDEESYDGENLDLESPDSLEELFGSFQTPPKATPYEERQMEMGMDNPSMVAMQIPSIEMDRYPAKDEMKLSLEDILSGYQTPPKATPYEERQDERGFKIPRNVAGKGIEVEKTKVKAIPAKSVSKKIK